MSYSCQHGLFPGTLASFHYPNTYPLGSLATVSESTGVNVSARGCGHERGCQLVKGVTQPSPRCNWDWLQQPAPTGVGTARG